MHDHTHCLLSGQLRSFGLRRHTLLSALDGPLHLTYRDASLDWLPGGAGHVAIVLDDGAAHRLPCAAWVDIRAGGGAAGGVTLGISSPSMRMSALLRAVLARAARALRRHRAEAREWR
ncbi:MAG: hypothetical protein ACRYHA_00500 [Janthinobacterium lividum]